VTPPTPARGRQCQPQVQPPLISLSTVLLLPPSAALLPQECPALPLSRALLYPWWGIFLLRLANSCSHFRAHPLTMLAQESPPRSHADSNLLPTLLTHRPPHSCTSPMFTIQVSVSLNRPSPTMTPRNQVSLAPGRTWQEQGLQMWNEAGPKSRTSMADLSHTEMPIASFKS
jgi:hypothetical protein